MFISTVHHLLSAMLTVQSVYINSCSCCLLVFSIEHHTGAVREFHLHRSEPKMFPLNSMHSNNLGSVPAARPGPGSFPDGLRRGTGRPILFFPKEFHPREREFRLHCIAFAPSSAAVHSFLTGFQYLVMHVAPLCCGWCIEKKRERFFNAFLTPKSQTVVASCR